MTDASTAVCQTHRVLLQSAKLIRQDSQAGTIVPCDMWLKTQINPRALHGLMSYQDACCCEPLHLLMKLDPLKVTRDSQSTYEQQSLPPRKVCTLCTALLH